MKKAIILFLLICSFGSCKKYCEICTDANGSAIREKCFSSNSEKFSYYESQVDLPNNQRCR